jgi:hypothetical protein
VVRSLAYELTREAGSDTRLIAFDLSEDRYFALRDPDLIRSADTIESIPRRIGSISTSMPSPPETYSSSPIPPGPSR